MKLVVGVDGVRQPADLAGPCSRWSGTSIYVLKRSLAAQWRRLAESEVIAGVKDCCGSPGKS